MTKFTAEYMNRANWGYYEGQRLVYLNRDQDSGNYRQISVNPIDEYTWGAATRGADDECYGILAAHDPTNPTYGYTRFTRFGKTEHCRGSMATPTTVRGTNPNQWNASP